MNIRIGIMVIWRVQGNTPIAIGVQINIVGNLHPTTGAQAPRKVTQMTDQFRDEVEMLVLEYNEDLLTGEVEMTFDEMVDLLVMEMERGK